MPTGRRERSTWARQLLDLVESAPTPEARARLVAVLDKLDYEARDALTVAEPPRGPDLEVAMSEGTVALSVSREPTMTGGTSGPADATKIQDAANPQPTADQYTQPLDLDSWLEVLQPLGAGERAFVRLIRTGFAFREMTQELERVIAERDAAIIQASRGGYSRRAVAQAAGITVGRVQQILDAHGASR
jgi:hypothetical protein